MYSVITDKECARLSGKGDKMRMTDTEKLIKIIVEHPELTGQIRMILSQITQQNAADHLSAKHLQ